MKLVNMMEGLGFVVCNGRSPSDTPANFTFISSIGKSIIDLVWVNHVTISDITDFEVVNAVESSDHLGCLTNIKIHNLPCSIPSDKLPNISGNRKVLRWNPDLNRIYQVSLNNSRLLYYSNDCVNSLFDNLNNAIVLVARELGLCRTYKVSNNLIKGSPWFDTDCRQAKRERRQKYRLLRRNGYANEYLLSYLESCKSYVSN